MKPYIRRTCFLLLFVSILSLLLIVAFSCLKRGMEGEYNAIWNNHCHGLIAFGQEWKEKGRPMGGDLASFVTSYGDQNLAVENRLLQVGTNTFYVLISRREQTFQYVSKIFLCTNDVIIAEGATGIRTIVTRSPSGNGWEPKPHAVRH